jgi:hypothetical protein
MFIYKITVIPINKIYIGLDTKPEYKMNRWKSHCRLSEKNAKGKLHSAMHEFGIDNCSYEVIERGFKTMAELALAEISLIQAHNSYVAGLNSSLGGDGLGKHDLIRFTEDELSKIRHALGEHYRVINQVRWEGTTAAERTKMMQHCYTPEVIEKRIITQKAYYDNVPGAREKHSNGFKQWRRENPELSKKIRTANGAIGAAKVSKAITLERDDGTEETFASISACQRATGQWLSTLKQKSLTGTFHNGYRIKK